MAVGDHSLGRWGSIKSVGRNVENEDGVAGVGLEPVLCADVPVLLRVFFRDHLAIVLPQHSF